MGCVVSNNNNRPLDEDVLAHLVDGLTESYARNRCQRRDGPRPPAKEAIVSALEQVRALLFPGFYADEELPAASERYRVGMWLCRLHTDLARVLRRAFTHDAPQTPIAEVRDRAARVSNELMEALPGLREMLLLDAEAALDGDPAAHDVEEVILTYPGFEAITVHRIAHFLYQHGVPYVPRAMAEHAHARTGIDIHPGARIGRRFFIDHGTGVVVGETTDIGDDVKLYQGVTLGALSVSRERAGTKRHPTIEEGVVIYAGATVLGGRTVIGREAVIGGNVWITSSVDAGTTVIESPPTLKFRAHEAQPEVGPK
jgi:serine O-acetyltransferase